LIWFVAFRWNPDGLGKLAKAGYIRIIVTTNFGRLLEMALTDVAIQPTMVSTADGVKGFSFPPSYPLSHPEDQW
jgi:hypothetical protein